MQDPEEQMLHVSDLQRRRTSWKISGKDSKKRSLSSMHANKEADVEAVSSLSSRKAQLRAHREADR